MDNGPEGTSYGLTFSNHNGAPLFPGARLTVLFKFRFIAHARMEPTPEREASSFRYVLFADSMPKQKGAFTYAEILPKHDSSNSAAP